MPRSWPRSGRRCPRSAPGIYLNTGLRRADARRDGRRDGRDRRLRAPDRPRRDGLLGRLPRAARRGARRGRRRRRRRRRRDRDHPLDVGGDERRRLVGRPPAGRPDRDDPRRASRRARARSRPPPPGAGAEVAIVDVGLGDDDDAILAAFDAAIRPGRGSSSLSHVLWTTGRPAARSRRSPARPRARRDRRRRRRPGRRRDPGLASPISASTSTRSPARSGCSGPEGTGALWASPGVIERVARVERELVHVRAARRRPRRCPGRTPAGSRTAATTGPASRASPGAAAGCRCTSACRGSTRAARRWPRSAADRLAAIDGVELLTPRDRMATLVTFRIARLGRRDARSTSWPARTFAIARTIPPLDAIRISVGFFTTEDEIERVASAVELLAAAHARDAAAAAAPDDPRPGRCRPMTPMHRAALRARPRGPPPLVARDPLAPVPERAAAGRPGRPVEPDRRDRPRRSAISPTTSRSGAAPCCPAATCGPCTSSLDVVVVLVVGSVVTWLVVPQPRGSGDRTTALGVERGPRVLRRRARLLPRPGRRRPGPGAAHRLSVDAATARPRTVACAVSCLGHHFRDHAPVMGMVHSYHSAVLSGRYHPVVGYPTQVIEDSSTWRSTSSTSPCPSCTALPPTRGRRARRRGDAAPVRPGRPADRGGP